MEKNIGQQFYLNGTKQRFILADYDLSGHVYLVALKHRKYSYVSYLQKRISLEQLEKNYTKILK